MKTFISDLSQKEFPVSERVSAKSIRQPILQLIQKKDRNITIDSYISFDELNHFRSQYLSEYFIKEIGELSSYLLCTPNAHFLS